MLINLGRIVRIFCLFFICFVGQSWANLTIVIQIKAISGGHAILRVEPGSEVTFKQRIFAADSDGYVAIGFAREVAGLHEFIVKNRSGSTYTESIWIDTRDYQVSKLNGVDQSRVTPPDSVTQRIIAEAALVNKARSKTSERTNWRDEVFIRPAPGRISGVYGSQRYYNGLAGSPHWGVDFASPTGTPIIAPAGGVVVLAEADLYFSGGTVVVNHGGGLTSSFLHLSKLTVTNGQIVEQGEVLGLIGATGRVTGPHLDWRMNLHGERIDAGLWLGSPLSD